MSRTWKLPHLALGLWLGLAAPTAMAQPSGSSVAARANQVGAMQVEERADGTYIRVQGSSVPTFSVFKMSDPPRLFVDISNSALTGRPVTEPVRNGVISQVAMLGVQDSAQAVTRVIIGFDQAAHYDVRAEGNDVIIFIDGARRQQQAPAADRETLAQQEARLREANAALATTRQRLDANEAQLAQLRQQLKDASGAERERLSAQIKTLNAARAQSSRDAAQAQRDADQARVSDEKAKLEGQLGQASTEKARLSAEKATLAQDKARLADEKDRLAAEKARLDRELAASQQSAQQVNAKLAQQTQQLQQARLEAKRLEDQLATVRAQASRGDGQAQRAVSELEREQAQTQQRLAQAQRERDQLQQQTELARAEQAKLQQSLASRERELEQARTQLAAQETARASRPAAAAVPVDLSAPNQVRDIRLEMIDGRSRIVVELDRPSKFETLPGRDSRAVMLLNGVKLPEQLERTLSARTQGGAVRFVSSFVDGEQVRMEAELRAQSSETILHEGNTLIWEFAPMVAQQPAPASSDALAAAEPRPTTEGQSFTSAPPEIIIDPSKVRSVRGMKRMRLTIDLREADIQNVLRMIATEGEVNVIAGDDVTGTVTMRLRSVPLDQVFLTILQSKGLGYELRDKVIRVAPQAKLLEEQAARAEARERSRRLQPLEVFLLPINYATAKDLVPQVQGLLSQRGSVTVDARTNTLIIKDIADNLTAMRMLVESLDAQVPQVLIEGRIVETNDNFQQQIGIQWGGDVSFSQANGNPTGLIFPGVLGLGGAGMDGQTPRAGTFSSQPNFAVNLPAPIGTGSGGGIGLSLGSVGGAVNLNIRLSALERAGHARIISAPKILTLDNREATISQGTSIPISVVSAAGVQTQFVEATLELTVTPHVTPDGNVQLKIKATKNEPDFQNTGARGDPTIIRRQAETELLIRDGDTTVIGGIYTRNSGNSISAVPFLHKIPILGFFFRTSQQSELRNELLIFITPRIVNRAEALGALSAGAIQAESASSPASAPASAPAAP